MTDTRNALKNSLLQQPTKEKPVSEEAQSTEPSTEETTEKVEAKQDTAEKPAKKKRRGRPAKSHSITKIHLILEKRGLTRKDLHALIEEKYPDEPISPDAVSRIVSGSRKYYSTTTLFRICGALQVTPNQVLDYESEIE